jgi:hypothetical protein
MRGRNHRDCNAAVQGQLPARLSQLPHWKSCKTIIRYCIVGLAENIVLRGKIVVNSFGARGLLGALCRKYLSLLAWAVPAHRW